MPASLPTSGFVPLASPGTSITLPEKVPAELRQFLFAGRQAQANPYDKALCALVKKLYPSSTNAMNSSPAQFLSQVAAAVNSLGNAASEIAQAAFTPETQIVEGSADDSINTNTWTDLTDLELEIVAPVPGRLMVHLQLDAKCVAPGADALEVRAKVVSTRYGTSNLAEGFVVMFSIDERWPITTFDLLDIWPQEIYTVTAQARVAVTGISDYTILGSTGRSALACRVEARSLPAS